MPEKTKIVEKTLMLTMSNITTEQMWPRFSPCYIKSEYKCKSNNGGCRVSAMILQ